MSDYPGRPFTRTRARLHARLAELLDDGTGRIRPELQPLADSLLAMPKPDRALNWLRNNPQLPGYLRALARDEVPLTQDGLHRLDSPRTAAHLRDLLMACGALPAVDRQILLFEGWTRQRLAARGDDQNTRLLRQFATWHQLPQLHAAARRAPLSPGSRNYAAEAFGQAEQLLDWLDQHELVLGALSQGDLDPWNVTRGERAAQIFLRWAQRSGHAPRLQQPPSPPRPRVTPISQHRRLSWTRRVLTDDTIVLRTRVAAGLLLLFAQPITRIVKLTVDDVLHHGQVDGQGSGQGSGQGVYLRLGDPPTPVPEPLARLLLALVDARANMNTASNPDSRWLFPGGRAGQPLTPGALRQQLQALGLPTTPARAAALNQLVLQAPAPVIAAALGLRRRNRRAPPPRRRRTLESLRHPPPMTLTTANTTQTNTAGHRYHGQGSGRRRSTSQSESATSWKSPARGRPDGARRGRLRRHPCRRGLRDAEGSRPDVRCCVTEDPPIGRI